MPNYIAHASAIAFNDPGRDGAGWATLQWNFLPGTGIDAPDRVAAPDRRGQARAAAARVIAVLDTGVAYRNFHRYRLSPDFSTHQFVQGYDFCSSDGRDEACTGHDRYPLDENGHGTHVARTIGEQVNNGIGVTGIAYGAKIMPVRVLNSRGEGDAVAIASGIRYAAKHGANVINLSLEFSSDISHASQIPEIIHALRYAAKKSVLIVGASGNEAETAVAYPARATPVISVGAVTEHGCQADYSNDGVGLDIVAPGGGADARVRDEANCQPFTDPGRDIYQWTYDGSIRRFGLPGGYEGTSMAAPHVSATAALVIASGVLGPNPTAHAIEQRLEQTARDLGPVGYDTRYGAGWWTRGGRPTRRSLPFLSALGRPDDQDGAGRVVRDLVGHRAQQEALGAGHALVAHDDQVGAALLGDVEDRVGGIALAREGLDLDTGLLRQLGGLRERGVDVLARVGHPLDVGRQLAGLLAQARLRDRLVGAHELEAGAQLLRQVHRLADRFARGLGAVGTHHDRAKHLVYLSSPVL